MKRGLWSVCVLATLAAGAADNITCISTVADIIDTRDHWTPEQRELASPALLDAYPASFLSLRGATPAFFSSPSVSAFRVMASGAQPADLTLPPFEVAGRLYYVNNYGKSDFCTAAFTNDPHVIMTAAHCVQQPTFRGPKFHTDFLFTRIYDHGSGEDFDIVAVGTVDEWITTAGTKDYEHDYAFLRTLDPVTGATPLTISSAVPATWTAVGYPNNYGVGDGKTMMYDSGRQRAGVTSGVIMEAVEMEHGASGGPWILFDSSGAIGTEVFAVTSTIGSDPETLSGALIGPRALELFKVVQANCKKAKEN